MLLLLLVRLRLSLLRVLLLTCCGRLRLLRSLGYALLLVLLLTCCGRLLLRWRASGRKKSDLRLLACSRRLLLQLQLVLLRVLLQQLLLLG